MKPSRVTVQMIEITEFVLLRAHVIELGMPVDRTTLSRRGENP